MSLVCLMVSQRNSCIFLLFTTHINSGRHKDSHHPFSVLFQQHVTFSVLFQQHVTSAARLLPLAGVSCVIINSCVMPAMTCGTDTPSVRTTSEILLLPCPTHLPWRLLTILWGHLASELCTAWGLYWVYGLLGGGGGGIGDVAQLVEHQTGTLLTQVQFPNATRDFCPIVNFRCRLSYGVHTPLCAIACIYICVPVKDPVVLRIFDWMVYIYGTDQPVGKFMNTIRERKSVVLSCVLLYYFVLSGFVQSLKTHQTSPTVFKPLKSLWK